MSEKKNHGGHGGTREFAATNFFPSVVFLGYDNHLSVILG
jgi:hypothetical protein